MLFLAFSFGKRIGEVEQWPIREVLEYLAYQKVKDAKPEQTPAEMMQHARMFQSRMKRGR